MADIPSWEEWNNLDKDVQEYERHRILLNLDNRLLNLESGVLKKAALIVIGSFFGGAAAMGATLLAKITFWKG